jgi:hypothetical protein
LTYTTVLIKFVVPKKRFREDCEVKYFPSQSTGAGFKITLFFVAAFLSFIVFSACDNGIEDHMELHYESPDPTAADQEIQVPPPPITEGMFPCMECHSEMEVNPERRMLEEFHDEIVLEHDKDNRWCLDCHDAENRDMLRQASGKLIPFENSYLLCGQCHGPKIRDWRAGVHGKRTGFWNGEKRYLLCVHCHNPHAPRFESMKPEAPPIRPEKIEK